MARQDALFTVQVGESAVTIATTRVTASHPASPSLVPRPHPAHSEGSGVTCLNSWASSRSVERPIKSENRHLLK